MFTKLFLYCCLLLLAESSETCGLNNPSNSDISIGVVIDQSTRVGKEQKIAMEMAVHDLHHQYCSKLVLYFKDYSYGNSAASATMDIVNHIQVNAIIGTITQQEAALLSDFKKVTRSTPIISISPTSHQISTKLPSFIQMSTLITYQMQFIATVIAHFKWKKVISIHEECNGFSTDSITQLSDSLRGVGSSIEHHLTLPCISSLSDPKKTIEQELKKLRNMEIKIFVLAPASIEFAVILFEKAKELGMMEKGYAWIVSDEIPNLLESVDSSLILYMQGIVGLKTDYVDNSKSFKKFKSGFRKKFSLEYPEEDSSSMSIYALRAYDSVMTVAKAELVNDPVGLLSHILSSDFEGLSGKISFKNSLMSQKPGFRIVNVIGKSYRELGFWSNDGLQADLSSIYWPGGSQKVPKGWTIGSIDKPLRIGIPAKGAFDKFVKVTYEHNQTSITGFSIEVFKAALNKLPYDVHYRFVPYFGSYDEMVVEVHKKSFDAAVGDTEIIADRYIYAEFSQPYMDSGLVMVVTSESSLKGSKFIAVNAFTIEMWSLIGVLSLSTSAAIWLSEHASGNEQFVKNSILDLIGSIIWLSFTMISFSQREHIRNGASKVVLGAWICVFFVVGASFTGVLSSIMTVPRLQPSVQNIDYLRDTNAVVGCNGNSFIVRYLIDVLQFKPQNIMKINSVDEYPKHFKDGDIKAAFFVAPHAKVFLAKYCKGYITSGRTFKLGGFGFVFAKGSPLAIDISEAILKATQSGEVNTLEDKMLRSFSSKCLSSSNEDEIRLGPGPLLGLFQVLGGIVGFTFFVSIIRLVRRRWRSMHDLIQEVLMVKRICICALLVLFRGKNTNVNVNNEIGTQPNLA